MKHTIWKFFCLDIVDENDRFAEIDNLIEQLPEPNRRLLRMLLDHLVK